MSCEALEPSEGRYDLVPVISSRSNPPLVMAAAPRRGSFRSRLAACALLAAVSIIGLGVVGGSAALAVPAQDPAVTITEAPRAAAEATRVADENRKIWMVVGGLVAVAIGLTVLTVRYWNQTRPVPVALAGADHVAADEQWEPRGTGENDRIEAAIAGRPVRPDRAQREAAYRAAGPI